MQQRLVMAFISICLTEGFRNVFFSKEVVPGESTEASEMLHQPLTLLATQAWPQWDPDVVMTTAENLLMGVTFSDHCWGRPTTTTSASGLCDSIKMSSVMSSISWSAGRGQVRLIQPSLQKNCNVDRHRPACSPQSLHGDKNSKWRGVEVIC